jgi:hypothetical protein
LRLAANFSKIPATELTILLILFFIHVTGLAQDYVLKSNSDWNSGVLKLKDGTIMEGFIHHDEKVRSIKFKAKLQSEEELSFGEMSILSMKYYDNNISKTREFYAWEVEDDGSTIQGPAVYEVVMVTKNFVVLTRKFAVLPTSGIRHRTDENSSKIEYDKVEKIFLAGEGTKAELLWLAALKGEESKLASQVQPFFAADVMKKYTGSYWRDVKSFVKKDRLDLERKIDLMKALTYFQQLENVK